MARAALIALLCIAALGAVSAHAYEFKLLNGMKVKGELRSFEGGRFYVNTDFGKMVIDADKLDYIIVEESDPGPSGEVVDRTPGIGFGMSSPGVEKAAPAPVGDSPVPCPQPLADRSIAPAKTAGQPVRPSPLGDFSIDPAAAYPGIFRGSAK